MLSIKQNQILLKERQKTIYAFGRLVSFQEEQRLLQQYRKLGRFVGVIPMKCRAGTYFYVSFADDHVANYLFWFGAFGYERASSVLFSHIAKSACATLDLGSYTGYYSILASKIALQPNIICIEANPFNYHRLTENLSINGVRALKLNRALVPIGENAKFVDITYDGSLEVLDTGSFVNHKDADLLPQKLAKNDSFKVRTVSIEKLLAHDVFQKIAPSLDSPLLVKLDIEGLEAPIAHDLCNKVSIENLVIFVEILSESVFKLIQNIVVTSNVDAALLYIDEYLLALTDNTNENYKFKDGCRNFVLCSKSRAEQISRVNILDLLAAME